MVERSAVEATDAQPMEQTSVAQRPLALTYIIGTYPLLTTTFIDREIRTLRSWGVDASVISVRGPVADLSPDQKALAADTHYVMSTLAAWSVIRHHFRFLAKRPGRYLGTLVDLIRSRHPSWRSRLRTIAHFGLAVHVAGLIDDTSTPDRLHAHFADRAALIALVAGRILDLPYSLTAHANDIYVEPVLLEKKLAGAEFVATCTGYNATYLSETARTPAASISRIYHGLPLADYSPHPRSEEEPPVMVAVGQLKEKKGFAYLIEACSILAKEGVSFRCEIIGEGPLRTDLERAIAIEGLQDRLTLRGALPHNEVIDAYRRAALFVLPCVVADDGDRDGIPNVILEASAMELPVVSTRISGIPEAVEHGETGLLTAPGSTEELTAALKRLLGDAEERRRFGEAGRQLIGERFDVEVNVKQLHRMFQP